MMIEEFWITPLSYVVFHLLSKQIPLSLDSHLTRGFLGSWSLSGLKSAISVRGTKKETTMSESQPGLFPVNQLLYEKMLSLFFSFTLCDHSYCSPQYYLCSCNLLSEMERSLLTQPAVLAEGIGAVSSRSILEESGTLREADPHWRHPGGALEPPCKPPQLLVRLRAHHTHRHTKNIDHRWKELSGVLCMVVHSFFPGRIKGRKTRIVEGPGVL